MALHDLPESVSVYAVKGLLVVHETKVEAGVPFSYLLNSDFASPFTPWFLFRLRRYNFYETLEIVLHWLSKHLIKNTLLHVLFLTLFLVFGYPDETLSLVFDI